MGLNKEQREAVEYLDGPLLVLAGPGTGKTQLLSAKVAYILENTDTNPENILCLTFTESGASNMRERLGSMIGKAASSVNIFTYHAFGSNILERYKNYAENFNRELDNVIDSVTQYKYVREIQDGLAATNILKTTKVNDLIETISHAKSARLSADDLAKIATRNIADSEKISAASTEILENLKPRMKYELAVAEVYQPLLEALSEYASNEPNVGNVEPSANGLVRELAEIIETESAKDKPSVSPLTKWKNQRFERDSMGNYRLKDYIANKKLAALSDVMRTYEAKLRSEGMFDFADMIEEAIRALREDRGFRLSLSEIFQYILLDEFQDTNPSQFELIKLLTDYESPCVMAVGDDDQAIFEFQGANASNLLDYQEHYGAKVITLLDNYRSTSEILAFSHRVAEQVGDSFAKHHGVAKVLRSMFELLGKKQPVECQIERHEFSVASDEYYWVAERIRNLIDSGENPDEIAVIAPKHKHLAPLLPYLKNQNINIAYEKKSNLLEDPKIHELIVVAEFANDLANEKQPGHRLLEILSFPWLEIDTLQALEVAHSAKKSEKSLLEYLRESEDTKLQRIAQWLADLAMQSFEAPLELWLDYLIGARELNDFHSPYLAYYEAHGSKSEVFEFYENLNALKNTVIQHTQNQNPRPADLINMIHDYEEADASIINTSPYRDAEHSVQLMSAHKSKGLEFKWVFMIAVDELAWGKAKGNNNMFSLPSNLSQIRHTGVTDDEKLRLLFVAITRAKEHLVMTNSVQDFSEKQVARLGYLDEVRDEKAEIQISPYLPEGAQEIHTHYDEFDEETRLSELRQDWISSYQVLTPDIKLLLQVRLANYRLTATDLTSFIDIIYAGPQAVYKSRVLSAPDEPLTMQLAYGNLIHSTLEQVTNQGIDQTAALKHFREKATEVPLQAREIRELQEKGEASLKIVLEEFQDILRADGAKGEVNLSSEHLSFDEVPVTGKIDHINIDRTTKTIEVYDFKTGNYHDNKWQSHPTLYKYALQLEFYKLLLSLSPSYCNYKVTKGHILFVSPDVEGKVYDKVYEYDDAGAKGLRMLAKVIYRQITSLEFIENPEINIPGDKRNTLKDIRAFVEKLLELHNT